MTLHSLSSSLSLCVDEAIVIKWRQQNMKENFYNQLNLHLHFSSHFYLFFNEIILLLLALLFWVPLSSSPSQNTFFPHVIALHFYPLLSCTFLFSRYKVLEMKMWNLLKLFREKSESGKIHNKKNSRDAPESFFFNENSLKWVAPFASSHCMLKWNLIRTLKRWKESEMMR